MPRHSHYCEDEHPLNHPFQYISIILFIVLWIPDSFIFRFTTFLSLYIPWYVSIPIGLLVFVIGIYFVYASHKVVFNPTQESVIDTGVYGRVRHPMYLGSLLGFLGPIIATLSLITLLLWLFVFIGFNYMASFEERMLIERFGDTYRDYQQRVSKWFPH